jgi:hypothetical protein
MFRALMFSTSALGKLFSMPNRTPIVFMPFSPSLRAARGTGVRDGPVTARTATVYGTIAFESVIRGL